MTPVVDRALTAVPPPAAGDCRELFRSMASGVTVVTTDTPTGPVGMTASAVMSLSMDPPLVVLSLGRTSATLRALRRSGRFALHLLRDDQEHLATGFARACSPAERFAGVRTRPGSGPPVIADTLAAATCGVERVVPGGDHALVIARLHAVDVTEGAPLLWHRSDFHRLTDVVRLDRTA